MKDRLEEQLLKLLEEDARLTPAQMAAATGAPEDEVTAALARYERDGVIVGYQALVDWDKTDKEFVTALIEVKVTPSLGEGFDKVAERIYQHPEVQSVYLMSGGFDLTVIIEGRSMKEVALFVAEKLAPMESVLSTATHFVLKKYKDMGVIYKADPRDERETV